MRVLLAVGLTFAAASPGHAQQPAVPQGARAAQTAAKSEANLTSAERQAEDQRRSGEERFKRRDDAMRKSMRSICKGC